MKKFTVPVLNIILAAGVICILAGLLLISYCSASFREQVPVVGIFSMITGSVIFYISLVWLGWASFFFAGLYLFASGLLYTFIHAKVVESDLYQLWPLFVVFCGISLLFTCIFKHKKIRGVYLTPSVILVALGFIFMLFSFHVLHFSFVSFISKWFPVILICLGAILVGVFLYQKNSNLFFPYDKDELADNTDDRDILSGE